MCFRKTILVIIVILFVSVIFCYSGIISFCSVGFGGCGVVRYLNSNPYLAFPDVGAGIGFTLNERVKFTFDYEYNYILPFKTKDEVREYRIINNDFLATAIVTIYKMNSVQFGLGLSCGKSYLNFLEDDYLDWTPFDSVFFSKGETVDMYDFPEITGKISFLSALPILNDHLIVYGKLKGKTGQLGGMLGSYIPSSPHIPFHFSLGITFFITQ